MSSAKSLRLSEVGVEVTGAANLVVQAKYIPEFRPVCR